MARKGENFALTRVLASLQRCGRYLLRLRFAQPDTFGVFGHPKARVVTTRTPDQALMAVPDYL